MLTTGNRFHLHRPLGSRSIKRPDFGNRCIKQSIGTHLDRRGCYSVSGGLLPLMITDCAAQHQRIPGHTGTTIGKLAFRTQLITLQFDKAAIKRRERLRRSLKHPFSGKAERQLSHRIRKREQASYRQDPTTKGKNQTYSTGQGTQPRTFDPLTQLEKVHHRNEKLSSPCPRQIPLIGSEVS